MNNQNFTLTCGEDRTLTLTARDANGDILNLTGATIAWRMAPRPGETSVLSKTGTITSAANGTFTVALTSTDTAPTTILARRYWYQALVTISSAVTAAVQGRISFLGQITAS